MNRHPRVSAWRRVQHWQTVPPWVPRGGPPPRICTSSSSSWRPSHPWSRGTALWFLLRVTCRYRIPAANVDLEGPPTVTSNDSTSPRYLDFDSTIAGDLGWSMHSPPICDYFRSFVFPRLSLYAFYALIDLTASRLARARRFIPDFLITENIVDRKRGSLGYIQVFLFLDQAPIFWIKIASWASQALGWTTTTTEISIARFPPPWIFPCKRNVLRTT